MKLIVLCVVIIFSMTVIAQEPEKYLNGFDPLTDIISEEYEAGAFLIYDCKARHWTCVQQVMFEDCKIKRDKDSAELSPFHSCAPVGDFGMKKSCFERQAFMVTQAHGQRFCVKDGWKGKAVKF